MRPGPAAPGVAALLVAVVWMWLAMMLTHELGHALAAWATGGEITSLDLRPGRLSHTLVAPNPHPSVVLWGGLLFGWLAPHLTAPAWRIERGLVGAILRCWAAFCLLAGGAYLAIGGGERLADTGRLVAAGWPLPLLIAIGAGVAAMGYWRSRGAWIAIAQRLETSPPGWPTALAWWGFLVLWTVGQAALHEALQPVG